MGAGTTDQQFSAWRILRQPLYGDIEAMSRDPARLADDVGHPPRCHSAWGADCKVHAGVTLGSAPKPNHDKPVLLTAIDDHLFWPPRRMRSSARKLP